MKKTLLSVLLSIFTISIMAQNWSTATIVATAPTYVYELASGDLNGDGFDDVITTTTATDLTLHWYLNDGAGNFTQYSYDTNFRGAGMTIYDLDGDGDLDIIGVGTMSDIGMEGISWWENDGNNLPTLTRHNVYITSSLFDGGKSPRIYDADNDGDMDIIAGSYSDDRLSYFKNPGTPTTLGWTKVDILSGTTDADGINYVDVGDGDGDTDVIVTVYTADKITIKERTGSSSYTSRVVATGYDAPNMVKFAGDLDGDGHNDLISTSHGTSNKLSWWKNGGNISAGASNWTENTLYSTESSYGVFSFDADNDGDIDIFAAISSPSGTGEDIVWYENDGAGNFTLETIYSNQNIYENYGFNMFLTTGDVNNNGKMDLIITAANNDTKGDVFYFLNQMTLATCLTNVSISSQINPTCNADSNGTITVSSTGFTSPSYTWSNGGTGPTIANLGAGSYQVIVSDSSCVDSITATLTNPPAIDNSVTQINDSLTANQSGATYQWIDCNNGNLAITGATNQSYTPTISGSYAVVITLNSCTDTSSCNTTVSVKKIKLKEAIIEIYPNPADSRIFIKSNDITLNKIKLFDVLGKELNVNLIQKENNLEIDVSSIQKGIYIIEFTTNHEKISKRIIIK